jgi:hypothetical protein
MRNGRFGFVRYAGGKILGERDNRYRIAAEAAIGNFIGEIVWEKKEKA